MGHTEGPSQTWRASQEQAHASMSNRLLCQPPAAASALQSQAAAESRERAGTEHSGGTLYTVSWLAHKRGCFGLVPGSAPE